uniref:Acrosin-binding protein n=1 Tax=Crocodylus porosus TaxID=8502 RepID=A0A7M4FK69_CROPO
MVASAASHFLPSRLFFHLFIFAVFLNWCSSANSQNKDPPRTGTPLSKEEYVLFFKPLNPPHRASAICLMRALYGCQNPLIKQLDEYENHGCGTPSSCPVFPPLRLLLGVIEKK